MLRNRASTCGWMAADADCGRRAPWHRGVASPCPRAALRPVSGLTPHVRREVLGALTRFPRIVALLDGDPAGKAATALLQRTLGARVVPVPLPGAKDVAELALRPDGRAILSEAIARATAARAV